jgi:hypothetical protein
MNIHRVQLSFLACLICLLSGCSGGEKSDKLSRATAMDMVKAAVGNKKYNPPDVVTYFRPDAQFGIVNQPKPQWVSDEAWNHNRNVVLFKANVVKWMESVGWVKQIPCTFSFHTVATEGADWTCYAPNRPEIHSEAGNLGGFGSIAVPMTKLDKFEITGIQQEGAQAVAEFESYVIPTEFYVEQDKSGQHPSGSMDWWWPNPNEVTKRVPWQVYFAKYDDGWRIVNR